MGGAEEVGSERTEELAQEHPYLILIGRAGWIAKGLVYALTGVLAFLIAVRSASGDESSTGDGEASQSGAVAAIAERPAGSVLLLILAIGLGIYGAWRIVTLIIPADTDAETWATRLAYAVSAVTSLLLALTAVSFALDPGDAESDQDAQIERMSRAALEWTGGRIAVFLAGVVVGMIAVFFARKAMAATFSGELAEGGVGAISDETIVTIGRVGWFGRSAMMLLIGFFLVRAAVLFDADEAQGLDGSLRQAAGSPLGLGLVAAVGLGLFAYGVFCLLSAPNRKLVAADG